MEEAVGIRWHRLITRLAGDDFPRARVRLADEAPRLAMVFRALSGDPGLTIKASTERNINAWRPLAHRLAGSGRRHALAWREADALRVPEALAVFPQPELNRDLYLWLTAMASQSAACPEATGCTATSSWYCAPWRPTPASTTPTTDWRSSWRNCAGPAACPPPRAQGKAHCSAPCCRPAASPHCPPRPASPGRCPCGCIPCRKPLRAWRERPMMRTTSPLLPPRGECARAASASRRNTWTTTRTVTA